MVNARLTIKQMQEVFQSSPIFELNTRRIAIRRQLRHRPDDSVLFKALHATLRDKVIRLAATDGVFITYSAYDAVFAADLDADLTGHQVKSTMGAYDRSKSDMMQASIRATMDQSNVLLLIISESSLRDMNVIATYEYFWNAGKIIVPIMFEPCNIDHLLLGVAPLDFYDQWKHGLRRLHHLVSAKS
ncbi:MAG: toll/interleukin-1 receptor domain-containing protein [Anaerolineae bacterium]|nr:toll/interleukin-1 receptor domain-containing protein [Anaerolineae bacterium]